MPPAFLALPTAVSPFRVSSGLAQAPPRIYLVNSNDRKHHKWDGGRQGIEVRRSEINSLIEDAQTLLAENNLTLPPFAHWSPADWQGKGTECDEIRDCMLGWDITDFGLGRFRDVGIVLFTVRNGHPTLSRYVAKTYCEKIMILQPGQHCPMHFHWQKTEDIINRCGGELIFRICNSTPDGGLADTDVIVSLDGVRRTLPAGALLTLLPGASVTLTSGLYHEFWASESGSPLIVGEVSKVNDDKFDNRFLEPVGRFPRIEEDCPPNHYLCTEYPPNKGLPVVG
jgi:D-lyxose ketol-isomerase